MSILGVESPSGGSVGKPKCTVGSGPSRRRAFACFGGVVVAVFVAGAVWERYFGRGILSGFCPAAIRAQSPR